MDVLIEVVLPLSLAFIMFSLGVGLVWADFTRVFQRKKAFAIGALCQIVLLPIVAFGLIRAWGLTGELAAGFMLLAFCPGGGTSNVLSRLARADVALSVSLTALMSLVSIVTVPALVALSVGYFMGADAPRLSVTSLAIAMFFVSALPVALGMALRRFAPNLVARIEGLILKLATALFALIVLAAVASNWVLLMDGLSSLAPATLSLVVLMLALGLLIAGRAGLNTKERKTIAVETGIQNGTLGITLAPMIVSGGSALPQMALPSAMYGVVMYVVIVTALPVLRRM